MASKRFKTCFFILHLVETFSSLTNLVAKPEDKTYLVVKKLLTGLPPFIEIAMNSQPKCCTWSRHFNNITTLTTASSTLITFFDLFCVLLLRPAPPLTPNQPIDFDDCLNLGRLLFSLHILSDLNCGRGFCERSIVSCVMYFFGSCGISVLFFFKKDSNGNCNLVVHFQSHHMWGFSHLYPTLINIFDGFTSSMGHVGWFANKSAVSYLYEVATILIGDAGLR